MAVVLSSVVKTVVMCKIKHLQKCCKMFQCFILHVTTSNNVLKMFHSKAFVAKMLQNVFLLMF